MYVNMYVYNVHMYIFEHRYVRACIDGVVCASRCGKVPSKQARRDVQTYYVQIYLHEANMMGKFLAPLQVSQHNACF